MPDKLDTLEFNIISLLKKHEPKMLRWGEIVKSLWETYKFKYKNEKGFGVAVTSKLNLLVASNKIKKEEIYYGTILSVLAERASNKDSWNPAPKIEFSVTQQRGSSIVQLPTVAFNLVNWSPYQLKIRLQVWTFLGGRNLGLINDYKGYYNGKILILAEPDGGGFGNGCFTVPSECVNSNEELSLSLVATLFDRDDPDKKPYKIIGSYTHRRKENDWFYEPTLFIDETESPSAPENWDSLLRDFSKAGANLIDVEVEKHQSGTKSAIRGVMVLRGAKKLQDAIKMYVPDEYDAFLFTEASLDKYDMLTWQGIPFRVKDIEEIYDVYSLSHRIAKLVKPPPHVEPAFLLF